MFNLFKFRLARHGDKGSQIYTSTLIKSHVTMALPLVHADVLCIFKVPIPYITCLDVKNGHVAVAIVGERCGDVRV